MADFMKISIITPVRNRATLFKETAHSVFSQTSSDWEWIVVDDSSDQENSDQIESVCGENKQAHFFKREGDLGGACVSRNQAVKKAQGDYLIFLDADDLLSHCCVQKRLNAAKKHPEADFLVFPNRSFCETAMDLTEFKSFPEPAIRSDIYRFFAMDSPWITTGVLWRRSFFERVGGWDESLKAWQDWELNVRALTQSPNYVRIYQQADCFWRKDASGAIGMQKHTESKLKEMWKVVLKSWEKIPAKEQLPEEVLSRPEFELSRKALKHRKFKLAHKILASAKRRKGARLQGANIITVFVRIVFTTLFRRLAL